MQNVTNTHGGVFLWHSGFLYCTIDTKLRQASQMVREIFLISEIP